MNAQTIRQPNAQCRATFAAAEADGRALVFVMRLPVAIICLPARAGAARDLVGGDEHYAVTRGELADWESAGAQLMAVIGLDGRAVWATCWDSVWQWFDDQAALLKARALL